MTLGEGWLNRRRISFKNMIDFLYLSWKASYQTLRDRFGCLVAASRVVLVGIIGISFYVWSNWKDFKERPGVSQLVTYFSQKSIPAAPAGRLTVAVANLEDDKDHEQEKLLLDGLRDFEGVETLTIDRLVEWPASGTEQEKKKKLRGKRGTCSSKPAPMS